MEKRSLFKEGPFVSAIGFGAWPLGGGMGHVDENTAIQTLHASIDLGITFIDTAQAYRHSEAVIGKALRNHHRDHYFLATKVSQKYSKKDIITAMNNSLKALSVEYVDLYQIHHWNPQYPIEETMETLLDFQKQGKTRYIGVSNFKEDHMKQATEIAPFQTNQLVYNLFDREIEKKEIPYCLKNGIGILAHSALAKGLLGGKYQPGHQFTEDDERRNMVRFQGETLDQYLASAQRLKQFAQERDLTLVQLAIAWLLHQPGVACVLAGPKNKEQLQEYLGATGIAFSEEEKQKIESLC